MNWRAAIGYVLANSGIGRLPSRGLGAKQARHRLPPPKEASVRIALGSALILAASGVAAAEAPPLAIEQLLAQGWEIAGYASGYDNRTSLILFHHAGTNALVQCGVLYDVTRNPRTIVNCYELR
jgi:hypothetical protein